MNSHRVTARDGADPQPDHEVGFPSPLAAWLWVAVLFVLGIVAFLDRQIISLMVGMIKADLGVDDFHISLLQGPAFGLLYAFGGLPLGYAVDRYSRRMVIFLGVAAWSIAAMTCGLTNQFAVLFAARVGVGFGEAALAPAAYSILSDMFPRRKLAFAISVYGVGTTFGAAFAFVIGGVILTWSEHGGLAALPFLHWPLHPWQVAFLVTGAPGLLLAFLIFALPEPVRQNNVAMARQSRPEKRAFRRFMQTRKRFLICLIGGYSCNLACNYAQFSWMAAVLQRKFNWAVADIGLRLGLISAVAGMFGLLVNGSIVDRLFARGYRDAHLRYGIVVMAIGCVSALLSMLATGPWIFLLLMMTALAPMHFVGVGAAALQIATPSHLRGRASGLFLAIVSIFGLSVGPTLPAFLTDHLFGYDAAVQYSLAIALAVLTPIGAMFYFFGLRAMREAVFAGGYGLNLDTP